MTGHLVAWTIELSQFHIEYMPGTAMKSQCLLDFIVECQFSTPSAIERLKSQNLGFYLLMDLLQNPRVVQG